MAYIMEGPGPIDWENVNPGELFTIDLWRDYTDSNTLCEWHERDSKEARDRLIQSLLEHGHKFPPELEDVGKRIEEVRRG